MGDLVRDNQPAMVGEKDRLPLKHGVVTRSALTIVCLAAQHNSGPDPQLHDQSGFAFICIEQVSSAHPSSPLGIRFACGVREVSPATRRRLQPTNPAPNANKLPPPRIARQFYPSMDRV